MSKRCSRCKEIKTLDNFWKRKDTKTGYTSHCKTCNKEYTKAYRIKHGRKETPEQARKWNMKAKFGITPEQYDHMMHLQNGLCAICNLKCKSGRRLAIDHCHKTGRIRGLLCSECNNGIGKLKDDPNLLRKAIAYLEIGMNE